MPQRRSRKPASRSPRRRKLPIAWIVIGALAVVLLVYLVQRGTITIEDLIALVTSPSPADGPGAPATSSAGSIQAFFTTPSLVYPDVPRNRQPPPFEQALIADIDAARRTVDVATFEYNLVSISQALVRARQRGVTVRAALDREVLEKPDMAKWAGTLEQAGIPIAWEETDAFLHSKFLIIDSAVLWMGSWNLTNNDTYRNNNNLLRITAPALVQNYAAEFSQLAGGHFGNDKESLAPNPAVRVDGIAVENYFSPQDGAAAYVIQRLEQARRSIHFMAFSFTSDPIAEVLMERARGGVQVRGVMESRNVGGEGSEFNTLRRAKVDVLEDGNCYTMHHKVFIIDGRTVITGSYNFTGRAEDVNDENLVIIDDPALAEQYSAEFERVYRQAQEPTRCQN